MTASSHITRPLEVFLTERLPPSASSVAPLYRETAVCHAYMCVYAYGCSQKTQRPAQVMKRRCMRYLPEGMRIEPGLSDMALDVLATQRQQGYGLSPAATAMLDELRPSGPLRQGRALHPKPSPRNAVAGQPCVPKGSTGTKTHSLSLRASSA